MDDSITVREIMKRSVNEVQKVVGEGNSPTMDGFVFMKQGRRRIIKIAKREVRTKLTQQPEGIMFKVLSWIFCLGERGETILKKFWSHAAARKNFVRPSRGSGDMLAGKFKKNVQHRLKSHFWTLVTFTDSLIS